MTEREARNRAVGALLIVFLSILGLVIVLWVDQKGRETKASATRIAVEATEAAGEATETAWEPTRAAFEATRTTEGEQLLSIASQQRSLIEECRKLYGSSSDQNVLARRGPVLPWMVREDSEERNEVIWSPSTAVAPGVVAVAPGILTEASSVLQASEVTVLIIEVDHDVVGWYVPEGTVLTLSDIEDLRYPAYRVTVDLCVTYWPERVVAGVNRMTLEPAKTVSATDLGYENPGYPGRPNWIRAVEDWVWSLPVTGTLASGAGD